MSCVPTKEPSAAALGHKIRHHQESIRSLKVYIDAAVRLPDNKDEYTKEFGLNDSTMEQLDAQITDSLTLNQKIKFECEQFDKTTFAEMIVLLQDVKVYAAKAKINMPFLSKCVQNLFSAQEKRENITGHREDVKFSLERSGKVPQEVKDQAQLVSSGLGTFSGQCVQSAKKADLEMKSITSHRGAFGKEEGQLTRAVGQLKTLARMDLKNGPKCWVPLVGEVPRSLFDHVACRTLFDLLNKGGQSFACERISLTCEMMTTNWQKILDLLEPAKDAVDSIHGFFDLLQTQLRVIEIFVADLEQGIPRTQNQVAALIDPHEESWNKLDVLVEEVLTGVRLAHAVPDRHDKN